MSRLVAEHFNPKGRPKRRFATQREAAAFRHDRPALIPKRPYRCSVCGDWHLGTPSAGGSNEEPE